MLAALHILITSEGEPFGELASWLSWLVIVGGAYAGVRLAFGILRFFYRQATRPGPRSSE